MKYASVCDGIGAVHVAWKPLGWQCQWTSEIEPFPAAVVEQRFGYRNVGDMTQINTDDPAIRDIDLLVGGTPCQAFSVAGLRRSLNDERGNLTLVFVRLVQAIAPKWAVWENVPGVLSTKDNAFGCFLAGLVGEDEPLVPSLGAGTRWPDAGAVYGPEGAVAWRILDAQYFGLAQRRRRVFAVRCPRGGADPAKVLFECEGVRRDSAPSRQAGQGFAAGPANCLRGRSNASHRIDTDTYVPEVSLFLNAGGMGRLDSETETMIAHALTSRYDSSEDGCGRGVPIVTAFEWQRGATQNLEMQHDISPALIKNQTPAVAFDCKATDLQPGDIAPTAIAIRTAQTGSNGCGINEDGTAYTLDSAQQAVGQLAAPSRYSVRRLTPVECERLQGFPDNYTAITHRNKPAADGPRYKALGNSMAVPCMKWIGERIEMADQWGERTQTAAHNQNP